MRRVKHRFGLLLQFVESDGCLKHQQDVKPLLANVLYDAGNML